MLYSSEEWERIKAGQSQPSQPIQRPQTGIPQSGGGITPNMNASIKITPNRSLFAGGPLNTPKYKESFWQKFLQNYQKTETKAGGGIMDFLSVPGAVGAGSLRQGMENVSEAQRNQESRSGQLSKGLGGLLTGAVKGPAAFIKNKEDKDKYSYTDTFKNLSDIIGAQNTDFGNRWKSKGSQRALGAAGLGADMFLDLDFLVDKAYKTGKLATKASKLSKATKASKALGRVDDITDVAKPLNRINDLVKPLSKVDEVADVARPLSKLEDITGARPVASNFDDIAQPLSKFNEDTQRGIVSRQRDMLDETLANMRMEIETLNDNTEGAHGWTQQIGQGDYGDKITATGANEIDQAGIFRGMPADKAGFLEQGAVAERSEGFKRTLPNWSSGIVDDPSKRSFLRVFRNIEKGNIKPDSPEFRLLEEANSGMRRFFKEELAEMSRFGKVDEFVSPKSTLLPESKISDMFSDKLPKEVRESLSSYFQKQYSLGQPEELKAVGKYLEPSKMTDDTRELLSKTSKQLDFGKNENITKPGTWGIKADKTDEIAEIGKEIGMMEAHPNVGVVQKILKKSRGRTPGLMQADLSFLEKQGPHSQQILIRMEEVIRKTSEKKAKLLLAIEDGLKEKGLGKLVSDEAFQDAFWTTRELGKEGVGDVRAIDDIISDAVRPINETFREQGLEVWDPKTGANFQPQSEKKWFPRILSDSKKLKKNVEEFKQLMVDRRVVNAGKEADDLVQSLLSSGKKNLLDINVSRPPNMMLKRNLDIRSPEEMRKYGFEMNPVTAFEKWADKSTRTVSYAEEFGKTAPESGGKIMDFLMKGVMEDGGNAKEVNRIINKVTQGIPSDPTSLVQTKIPKWIRGFQTTTKLSPKTTISQMTQFTTINALADEGSTISGAAKALTKEGKRFATESGALDLTLIAGEGGGKITDEYLKIIGMTPADKFMRTSAANAGADFVKKVARKMVDGKASDYDMRRFKKLIPKLNAGDLDTIRKTGELTKDQLLKAGYYASAKTQFISSPLYLPDKMTKSEWSKVVFQFKPYLVGQSEFLRKEVIKEVTDHGNYAPLMRYVYGTAITGSAALGARNLYTKTLGGEPKEFNAANVMGAGPGLGIASSAADAITGGGYRAMSTLLGPTGSELGRISDLISFLSNPPEESTEEEQLSRAMDKLGRFTKGSFPIIRDVGEEEETSRAGTRRSSSRRTSRRTSRR